MNWATSNPAIGRSSPELKKRRAFKDRDRTAEKKGNLLAKTTLSQAKSPSDQDIPDWLVKGHIPQEG